MEMPFGLEPWLFWSLLGIALFILELVTPGFILACFGVGAVIAVLPAWLGLGLAWQLAVFSAGSFLMFYFLRPILRRKSEADSYPIGLEALKGRKIRLPHEIPADSYAEIPIDGDVWRIRMKDNSGASKGTLIVICGREGLMLLARLARQDEQV